MAQTDDTDNRLKELQLREEEELALMLSHRYDIRYLDLTRVSINSDALRLIEEPVARLAEIAGFDIVGKKLTIAVRSPQHPKLPAILEDLEKRGYTVEQVLVSRASLARAWEHYKDLSFAVESKQGVLDVSPTELKKVLESIHTIEDIQKAVASVTEMKRAYRVSKILEVVLAGAFAVDASDIHIEPEQNQVRLRYRLDGVLHDVINFDLDTANLLLSRLKLLSGLKLNLKNRPQDGRFSLVMDAKEIEIRASVIPGAYGETVVMRLLNPDTISVPFEALGMEPKLRALIEREIGNPNGMLLNTGPTGSGKTTTLYACMKKINSPEIKIITIEDPVEYHVAGLVQTQVDEKNYTFLQGLRSALRQDPDVIMIGEIRDEEVAKTAIDAALTGHFVFSTLHTNDAAGSFPRLVDLGVDPKVFGSAINIAMAQRLVRVLCKQCKKEVPLEGKNKERVDKVLAGLRDKTVIPADISKVFEPIGCSVCNNTGFKGRIGVFEAVVIDGEMDALLRTSPSEHEIQALQHKKEILTMVEDGIMKVLTGTTSLDELNRVVLIEETLK
ncbi:MAG: type II/IV secretion system protein [Candidatus Pacebacteria bacterium]|nr:type II/IV secretion system protein [Candidatus Paceibacterota bacterium]MBP9832326.1 type II/IV secretion system protein [Candidatus Paceibacterota bacterium]